MRNEESNKSTNLPSNVRHNESDIFSLSLPDPATLEGDSSDIVSNEKYQLQLRVDEATHRYLMKLATKVEAETLSELIRMSLRALERALQEYDEIHRADGFIIEYGKTPRVQKPDQFSNFRVSSTRRINVILRQAAHDRLNRLLENMGDISLVDLVMCAVGVIDASTRANTSEEVKIKSSHSQKGEQTSPLLQGVRYMKKDTRKTEVA